MENQSLLKDAVLSFSIDRGDEALSFDRRLARENGWTLAYAGRVVQEYNRFLYLCVAAGHPCTPSIAVDQAWHLHMVYTDSYWNQLCGEVLHQPLHHNPTKGGADEDAKFTNWYEKTLASYEAHFGTEPPNDIWPPSCIRFSPRQMPVTIVPANVWVIPKRLPKIAVGVGIALAAGGCLAQTSATPFIPLAVGAALVLGLIILVIYLARQSPRSGGDGGSGGCGYIGGHDSGHHSDAGGDSGASDGGGGCSSGCGGGGCGGGGCSS